MDLPLLPGGRRLDWEHLSAPVREALQARLGSPVMHAATQPGGFSPGLAARLRLAAAAEHGHDDLAGLDPWARRHLDRQVAVEQTWPAAAAGGTLLHLDLRADNLLLPPARVMVVDWPGPASGRPGSTCCCCCRASAPRAAPNPRRCSSGMRLRAVPTPTR